MTASATLSGYAAPATTMNSDRASSSSPVRREPTPIGLSSKANTMTIAAILVDYPDASPSLIESLGAILRRELEEDQRARMAEIALRAAREAQLRRLDAMAADDMVEAVPDPLEAVSDTVANDPNPEADPEPEPEPDLEPAKGVSYVWRGSFISKRSNGASVAWVEGLTRDETIRRLKAAYARWAAGEGCGDHVVDAWVSSPFHPKDEDPLDYTVTLEPGQAAAKRESWKAKKVGRPESKKRSGAWAQMSDAEVSAAISLRWVTRHAKDMKVADDHWEVVEGFAVVARPGWEKIDALIRKAIPNSASEEAEAFRRKAVELIGKKLPADRPAAYVKWAKASRKWLDAKDKAEANG